LKLISKLKRLAVGPIAGRALTGEADGVVAQLRLFGFGSHAAKDVFVANPCGWCWREAVLQTNP
jgi:hypothetical protein